MLQNLNADTSEALSSAVSKDNCVDAKVCNDPELTYYKQWMESLKLDSERAIERLSGSTFSHVLELKTSYENWDRKTDRALQSALTTEPLISALKELYRRQIAELIDFRTQQVIFKHDLQPSSGFDMANIELSALELQKLKIQALEGGDMKGLTDRAVLLAHKQCYSPDGFIATAQRINQVLQDDSFFLSKDEYSGIEDFSGDPVKKLMAGSPGSMALNALLSAATVCNTHWVGAGLKQKAKYELMEFYLKQAQQNTPIEFNWCAYAGNQIDANYCAGQAIGPATKRFQLAGKPMRVVYPISGDKLVFS